MEPGPITPPPSPIMKIEELAEYLRIHPATIYRMLKRNAIPAFKIGTDWRFHRSAIDQWVAGLDYRRPRLVKPPL